MKMREIKLMRIMTALSISVEDEQREKSNDFFFEKKVNVIDRI